MSLSTSTPMSPDIRSSGDKEKTPANEDLKYRHLVVDSGPLIRLTGFSALSNRAREFWTVPAVLQEIRDAKARQHIENLPFTLKTREPSAQALQTVVAFSRLTGDYHSLSSVDLHVLALLVDLEREACGGDMGHVRIKPKRIVGLGKIESMSSQQQSTGNDGAELEEGEEEGADEDSELDDEDDSTDVQEEADHQNEDKDQEETRVRFSTTQPQAASRPKSWATIVNPSAGPITPIQSLLTRIPVDQSVENISDLPTTTENDLGGQFSDAEEDDFDYGGVLCSEGNPELQTSIAINESDEDFDPEEEISDEECDVYIKDPDELSPKAQDSLEVDRLALEMDLQSDFPSLAASLLIPYEGSDDEAEGCEESLNDESLDQDEDRKKKSLQPITRSGKLYNTLGAYKYLLKPTPKKQEALPLQPREPMSVNTQTASSAVEDNRNQNQSRIIGGYTLSGQEADVEDDGEGWITSTKEIGLMKAVGSLDPSRDPKNGLNQAAKPQNEGPPISQRAACTTTDFAMQNVILQMNLELLSVDGIKVRKLKSWVTRCGACFKIYTSADNTGPLPKRLFCERCGSDFIQRIAASVDGKGGRLRLHLSKKHKNNLRGTKFSLPKPGSGNRFQGDLLLREDQLLTGAWNQKVKVRSGGRAKNDAQSMFGRDIASNVGCHSTAITSDDIRVGFGRQNPNSAKGRERRGKKKKSSDKACGLRRY